MKRICTLPAIIAAAFLLAPLADAAPKKKKTEKKTEQAPAPAPATVPDSPSAPQRHEQQYQNFVAQLKKIKESNAFDLSPALYTALLATQDEFCAPLWMQRAANEGSAPAQYFMAKQKLFNLPRDQYRTPEIKQAVALLKKASDAKYVPAMQEYSKCLRSGIGTIKNTNGADKLLMQACAGGSFETRFEWLVQSGRLDSFNDLQRPEVKAEIERGNHFILHHLSLLAPDDAAILRLLTLASDHGNSMAKYELSELCKGSDIAASYKYLRDAIRLRNPHAMFRMGMYMINPPTKLEINVGPVRNPEEGIIMLKLACMLGQGDAFCQLARLYYQGAPHLPRDPEKAFRHTGIGASLFGTPELLAARGFMQLTGQGTQKNTAEGLKLLKLAASKQHVYAKILLGYVYYRGIGVEKNISQAVLHLEDAATYKDPTAFIYLALIFDAENSSSKSTYYLEHAERAMPGKAKAIFKYYNNNPAGWVPPPFPPTNI